MKEFCKSCGGVGHFINDANGQTYICAECDGVGTINVRGFSPATAELLLTPTRVESVIVAEHYWRVPGTLMTVCSLVLKNGFAVIGTSGCASIEMFHAAIGREVARANALNEVRKHECYALRNEAMIVRVWGERCVNLVVFDADGNSHARTSVPLIHDDEFRPSSYFCEWMPYQIGQARTNPSLTNQPKVANHDGTPLSASDNIAPGAAAALT